MNIEQAIYHVLEGNALLFAGAGFSYGATNCNGDPLPDSKKLATLMLRDIKYDNPEDFPLSLASKSYTKAKSQLGLLNFLGNQLIAVNVKMWHTNICKFPWYRIYTTNFDNVIELSYQKLQQECSTKLTKLRKQKALTKINCDTAISNLKEEILTFSKNSITTDYMPSTLTQKNIIHLNGYLNCQEIFKKDNALRLSDESYITNELSEEWQEIFRISLRAAKAVIFIGFSAQGDYIIKKALNSLTALNKKAIFITKQNESQPLIDSLEDYGEVYQIGVDEFSKKLESAAKVFIKPLEQSDFKSFEKIQIDTIKQVGYVQSIAIADLHKYGTYKTQLLSKDKNNEYEVLLYRHQIKTIFDSIIKQDGKLRIYIFHSQLGNGKTMALRILQKELVDSGIDIYSITSQDDETFKEIETLCKTRKKSVIFFENFYSYGEIMKYFSGFPSANICLVSTARTAVYESNISILNDWAKGCLIITQDLNKIAQKNEEPERLISIFDNNALWGNLRPHDAGEKFSILSECNYEFKALLVKAIKSEDIISRYKKIITLIKNKGTFYKLCLFCIIKSLLSIDLSIDETLALFSNDLKGNLNFKEDENIKELLNFDNYSYKLDSSIVASKIFLENQSFFSDSITVLAEVIEIADKMKVNKKYYEMLKSLVSFKLIQYSFEGVENDRLLQYFDKVRNTSFCKDNHSFWVQFALACISQNKFEPAQRYIDRAYALVKDSKTYNTFQIDTVQAEMYLAQIKYKLDCSQNAISNYIANNQDYIISEWDNAHQKLLQYKDIHSKDDITKRFRLVKTHYIPIWDIIYKYLNEKNLKKAVSFMQQANDKIIESVDAPQFGGVLNLSQITSILNQALDEAKIFN